MTALRILKFRSETEPGLDEIYIGIPEGMTDLEAIEKSNAIHSTVSSSKGYCEAEEFDRALVEAGFLSIRWIDGVCWDAQYVNYEAPIKTLTNPPKKRRY